MSVYLITHNREVAETDLFDTATPITSLCSIEALALKQILILLTLFGKPRIHVGFHQSLQLNLLLQIELLISN